MAIFMGSRQTLSTSQNKSHLAAHHRRVSINLAGWERAAGCLQPQATFAEWQATACADLNSCHQNAFASTPNMTEGISNYTDG